MELVLFSSLISASLLFCLNSSRDMLRALFLFAVVLIQFVGQGDVGQLGHDVILLLVIFVMALLLFVVKSEEKRKD